MKIITNELDVIKNSIEKGWVDKKPSFTIRLYARYLWVQEQENYKKIKEEVETNLSVLGATKVANRLSKLNKERMSQGLEELSQLPPSDLEELLEGVKDKKLKDYKKAYMHKYYIEINKFLKANYGDYNEIEWEDIVKGIIKSVLRNDNPMINNVTQVEIYKSEVDYIKEIKGDKFQKLAFTYLVYARLLYKLQGKNECRWVESEHQRELFKDANVTDTGMKQFNSIHQMTEQGILELSFKNDNNNVKLTFNDKEMKEENISYIIEDFREIGLRWLKLRGDNNIGVCEVCSRLFIKKDNRNTSQKYCKVCKREKELEKQRKYNEKR